MDQNHQTVQQDFDKMNLDDDSDIDENYEDVEDTWLPASETELLSSIKLARSTFYQYINDEPEKALEKIKPLWCRNIYHANMYAYFAGLQAFLNFEQKDMQCAVDVVRECTNVIYRRRHGSSLTNNMVTKMVITPNYNSYTEEEVHAELCYAECLIIRAFLTIFQDGNLMSYLKGGVRIRTAYHVYKECQKILEHRTWNNDELRKEFESGVDLGIGAFNWIVAGLPSRILKVLKFIGFSGDRDLAFKRLTSGHHKFETLKGSLCTIALLIQSSAARFCLGYPKKSESLFKYCEKLGEHLLKECPKSPFIHYFYGRIEHVKGNTMRAIEKLETVVNSKYVLNRVPHVAMFELAFIYVSLGEWRKAIHYMDILCKECRWSRSTFFYVKGATMAMCKDLSDEEQQEMVHCMEQVPKYVQRFLGRSLPVEKFCFRKSERFFAQDNWLPIPILEIMYVFNFFYLLKGKNELLEPIMVIIDRTLEELRDGEHKESPWCVDNYCLVLFLKGLCLSYLGYPLSAEEYFVEVIQNTKNIVKDAFIPSFALMEMGYISMNSGNREVAIEYLTAARSTSIFLTEFRIHRGLSELRHNVFKDSDTNRIHF